MSHSQVSSIPESSLGVTITPNALTTCEEQTAKDLVLDGRINPVGIEPLVQLFIKLGLDSKGFLGAVLCPQGREYTGLFGGVHRLYKRTVPVWAVESGSHRTRRGAHVRGITYLNTKEFVLWLERNQVTQKALPSVPETRAVTQGPRTVPPAPSTNGGRRLQPPPPSYVSQLGDIRPGEDELSRVEGEFRATPRVTSAEGYQSFDDGEYFARLGALNEVRHSRGLRPQTAPTPSTYLR
jgi:hypothetical protein